MVHAVVRVVELTAAAASAKGWQMPIKVGKAGVDASPLRSKLSREWTEHDGSSPTRRPFLHRPLASSTASQKGRARRYFSRRKDHKALLDRIALEIEHKRECSRVTTPLARAITWALRGATSASDIASVLGDLDIPLPVFTSVIQKLGLEGHPSAANALVDWLCVRPIRTEEERPNVYIYNSLLGALKLNRRYTEMDQVLMEFQRRRMVPDVVTYNTVIQMHEERGNRQKALNVFIALKRAGVTPNLVTYRMVFKILADLGHITSALELFTELRDKQPDLCQEGSSSDPLFEPSRYAVSFGIHDQWQQMEAFVQDLCTQRMWTWLSEGQQASEMGQLFASMEAASVDVDSLACVDLLWKCGSREVDHVLVKRLYTVLRRREFLFSVPLSNHIIRALGKGKKWWAALQVFEGMVEYGPEPNEATYKILVSQFHILFNAARRRKIWKWSLQLLDKVLERGLDPGKFAWNAVLITCAKANATPSALLVFDRMIQSSQRPDVLSYGALLSAFEKAGWDEKAVRLWEHMKKVGVKPNDAAYTTMICVHGNSGNYDECVRLAREMQEEGIQLSLVTYNALITSCAKVGNSESALEWVDQMSAAWIMPDAITYDQLLRSFVADGNWEQAVATYQRMLQLNLQPSAVAVGLIQNCRFWSEHVLPVNNSVHEKVVSGAPSSVMAPCSYGNAGGSPADSCHSSLHPIMSHS